MRRWYAKRKIRTYGVTNEDVIIHETGNIVSSDSLQPSEAQSTTVSYNQIAEDCTIKSTTSQTASESPPEYSSHSAASNDALTLTPSTQDIVH